MALMPILAAPLARKGIQLTHVATPEEALRPEVLAHYDALMIYANHKTLTPAQEQALVSFVEGGKGLLALHCASAMFTEAARYIPIVGGEFSTHGTGEFSAEIVAKDQAEPFLIELLAKAIDEIPKPAGEKAYEVRELAGNLIDFVDGDEVRVQGGAEDA